MSGALGVAENVSPSGDALYSHFGFGDDFGPGGSGANHAASGHNGDNAGRASASAEGSSSGTDVKLSSPPTWQLETLRSRKQGECLNRLSERIYPLPEAKSGYSILVALRHLSLGNKEDGRDRASAVASYTQSLAESCRALRVGSPISKQLGRIRLGGLNGMDSPTVEIHKHLAAAVLSNRAMSWAKLGHMWKALMDSEDALAAFAEWGPCHFRLGEILVIAGDFQGALRNFQRAVAFSPSQKDYKEALITLQRQIGFSDAHPEGQHAGSPSSAAAAAAAAFAAAASNGGAPGSRSPGSRAAAAAASNPEELWVTRGGGQSRVWFELRCASCTAGLDLGEDMWRDASQLLGSDVGLFYAEQQQFLEAALSVVASSNGLTNLKGVLEGVLGRLDHTRGAFVCLALANILAWVGDFEDAAAFLEDAMNFVPTAAVKENQWLGVLHCNRSLCRLRMGDSEGAMADARRAVQLRPDWHRAHARIGCVLAEGGQWEAAMAHFQAALALCQRDSPESYDVTSYMAVARTRGAPSKDGPETLELCLNGGSSGSVAAARRAGSRGAGASGSGGAGGGAGGSGRNSLDGASPHSTASLRNGRSVSAGNLDRADSNTSLQDGSGDEEGRPAAATYGRSRRIPRPTRRNSHGSGSLRGGDEGGRDGEMTGSRSTRSSLHDEDEEERQRGAMPRKRSKQSLGDISGLDHDLAMPGPSSGGVADGALISARGGNANMFFEDSLDPFALPGVGTFPILKRGERGGWATGGESLNGSPLDGDEFLLGWDVVGALESGGLDEH